MAECVVKAKNFGNYNLINESLARIFHGLEMLFFHH